MMLRLRRLPAAMLAALAGCAVPDAAPLGRADSADARPPAATAVDWSDGLSLAELMAEVGRHGRALAALEEIEAARARRTTAETYPLNPEASFDGAQGVDGDKTTIEVGVRQTFELGGRGSRRVAVADAGIAKAGFESEDALRDLRTRAARAYWAAVLAARRVQIAATAAELATKAVDVAVTRYEARQATVLDVNLAKVAAGRARAAWKKAEGEASAARSAIAAFLGGEAPAGWTLSGAIPSARPRADLQRALAAAGSSRPDIASLSASSDEAAARAELARAEAAPDLGVGLGYEYERDRIEGDGVDIRKNEHAVTLGLTLTLPVWNRREGEAAEAEADRRRFLALRAALQREIAADVAAAVARLDAADDALALFETEIVPAATANLEAARGAYAAGALTITDLLRAQSELQEAVSGRSDAEADWLSQRTELEAAVGKPLESLVR